MKEIAISILSVNFVELKNKLDQIRDSQANWIHYDVMDNHFVPNISFGLAIFKDIKKYLPQKFYDIHLMCQNPMDIAVKFAQAGADSITIHYETVKAQKDMINLLRHLQSLGVKVAVAINPKTELIEILNLVKYCDMILLMSVQPGFGGQAFIESTYQKVAKLANYINKNNYNCIIQVDGGVNDSNAIKLFKLGANVLVMGSYATNGNTIEKVAKVLDNIS